MPFVKGYKLYFLKIDWTQSAKYDCALSIFFIYNGLIANYINISKNS